MASLGSNVQKTSNELVSVIEEMKERRAELDKSIIREQADRDRVLAELNVITARLDTIESSLKTKIAARSDLDKIIQGTSEAFKEIAEESSKLLHQVREKSSRLARFDPL